MIRESILMTWICVHLVVERVYASLADEGDLERQFSAETFDLIQKQQSETIRVILEQQTANYEHKVAANVKRATESLLAIWFDLKMDNRDTKDKVWLYEKYRELFPQFSQTLIKLGQDEEQSLDRFGRQLFSTIDRLVVRPSADLQHQFFFVHRD